MTPEQKSWKDRLKAVGVSQREFSELLSTDETVISLYLNEKREPIATAFKKIEETIKILEEKNNEKI